MSKKYRVDVRQGFWTCARGELTEVSKVSYMHMGIWDACLVLIEKEDADGGKVRPHKELFLQCEGKIHPIESAYAPLPRLGETY
jgi:hypothetical protein